MWNNLTPIGTSNKILYLWFKSTYYLYMKKIIKFIISTILVKVFYDVFNENKFVKEQIDKLKEEVTNLEMSDIDQKIKDFQNKIDGFKNKNQDSPE